MFVHLPDDLYDSDVSSIHVNNRGRRIMPHVLETGFEAIDSENPNGSPMIRGYNIIGGQLEPASDGSTFESKNPAILADCLGVFPLSTKDDVHKALKSAKSAFPGWSSTLHPHVARS